MTPFRLQASIYVNGKLVHTVIGYAGESAIELRQRVINSIQVTVTHPAVSDDKVGE